MYRFSKLYFFFCKQKTAYDIEYGLGGAEMCIRDRVVEVLAHQPQAERVDRRDRGARQEGQLPPHRAVVGLSLIHN